LLDRSGLAFFLTFIENLNLSSFEVNVLDGQSSQLRGPDAGI
jgi:hypothetical protein